MRSNRASQAIELTATEFRLLHYCLLNPRQVLTRHQLLDHVWDYDFGGDTRVLETYVSYAAKKAQDLHRPPLIHTVRGVGDCATAAGLTVSAAPRLRSPVCSQRSGADDRPRGPGRATTPSSARLPALDPVNLHGPAPRSGPWTGRSALPQQRTAPKSSCCPPGRAAHPAAGPGPGGRPGADRPAFDLPPGTYEGAPHHVGSVVDHVTLLVPGRPTFHAGCQAAAGDEALQESRRGAAATCACACARLARLRRHPINAVPVREVDQTLHRLLLVERS